MEVKDITPDTTSTYHLDNVTILYFYLSIITNRECVPTQNTLDWDIERQWPDYKIGGSCLSSEVLKQVSAIVLVSESHCD